MLRCAPLNATVNFSGFMLFVWTVVVLIINIEMKFCLAIVLLLRAVSVCPAGDCEG